MMRTTRTGLIKQMGLALAMLAALGGAMFLFRSTPAINTALAAQLTAIADRWCVEFHDQEISASEWPDEIRSLHPQFISVRPEGVYLQQGRFLIEAWGVFILRAGSEFQPAACADPSYRLLSGRVYCYEVKG
jgi:hypothetical protein